MVKSIKIFIFILVTLSSVFGQSISIGLGGSYINTLQNIDKKDMKNEDPKVPSLGMFYDDASSGFLSLSYKFFNEERHTKNFFLGFRIEKHTITSSVENMDLILGDEIGLLTTSLNVGVGRYFSQSFIYVYGAGLYKKYEGKGKYLNTYDVSNQFKNSFGFRTGFGIELKMNSKFGILIETSFDTSSIERDKIKILSGSSEVAYLEPIGDKILPDTNLNFSFSFFYNFNINW